jgi:hypothetical protein
MATLVVRRYDDESVVRKVTGVVLVADTWDKKHAPVTTASSS